MYGESRDCKGVNQMELALREAKARLSEIVVAAQNGERVVITKHGEPAVEVVRFHRTGGIDFKKLDASCERLGVETDEGGWPAEFDDPEFSRKVLGLP